MKQRATGFRAAGADSLRVALIPGGSVSFATSRLRALWRFWPSRPPVPPRREMSPSGRFRTNIFVAQVHSNSARQRESAARRNCSARTRSRARYPDPSACERAWDSHCAVCHKGAALRSITAAPSWRAATRDAAARSFRVLRRSRKRIMAIPEFPALDAKMGRR